MALLELHQVQGRYGELVAVRGLTLELPQGGSLGLLGRNGAGKSTVLKLISGVIPPTAGTVRWDGADVAHLAPEDRVRLGIVLVPEGRGVFPALSVQENLKSGAFWRRLRPSDLRDRIERVFEILPRLGDLRNRTGGSLSGGEQQMLAIGRALMSDPKVLLLDEPSLGLAPRIVEDLYQVFRQLGEQGIGLIIVEQYLSFVLGLCDQAIALDKGAVIAAGPAHEIAGTQALQDAYMASGLDAPPYVSSARRGEAR